MMPQWSRLQCDCGSEKFLKLVCLRWHPSGGSTEEMGGWECSQCGKSVDMASLITLAKLKQKKAELESLKEEIGQK